MALSVEAPGSRNDVSRYQSRQVLSGLMKTRLLLAILLASQLTAAGFAQQPTTTPTPKPPTQEKPQPATGDVVRITTNLVQVDAVVLDKQGKPVPDLKADELELFEDARKQKITNLSYQIIETSPGVHLQLTSLFANDPQQGSLVRSILYIDRRDLTFTEEPNDKWKCVFDLLAVTFGDNGIPIDHVDRTYTVVLANDDFKRAMREGLVYYGTVPIKKPGAYQLRMSLRDSGSERTGSASQYIDAPDIKKKRLFLSGLIIRGENAAALTQTAAAKAEGVEQGNAEASPAIRRLRPGMVASFGYFIYNARIDKVTSRPQVTTQLKLFRDGKAVFTGKEIPFDTTGQSDPQRLALGGAIQLGSAMEPGEYVLQVIVRDLLADKKQSVATQWMDFQIVN